MIVSLRLDDGLVARLDEVAKAEGRSRNNFVQRVLEEKLGSSGVVVAPEKAMPSKKLLPRGNGRVSRPAAPTNSGADSPSSSSHDPKYCRIYKCGQCAALGYKDKNRGLV